MDVYAAVIECPNTGKATRTGHDLSDLAQFIYLGLLPETVYCSHCGDAHTWTNRDAWLQRQDACRVHIPAARRPEPSKRPD
jgi:hypothetical protein